MNTILRNFVVTLKRFKTAGFLNFCGLSVAFAAFMIILMQVSFERNYDRFHKDASRIFRGELAFDQYQTIWSRPLLDAFLHSSPHIQAGTLLSPVEEVYCSVESAAGKNGYKAPVATCYPDIVKIFDFRVSEGSAATLATPGMVLIPESMARKFFGDGPAAGKTFEFREQVRGLKQSLMTVGGVYKDFPSYTLMQNAVYVMLDKEVDQGAWGNMNYLFFIKLDEASNKDAVTEQFVNTFDFKSLGWSREKMKFRLNPLPDVYYTTDVLFDIFSAKGNKDITTLLCAIALLVLLIAGVNFVNFASALTPLRIKSINTQKVLGSPVFKIRLALILESVMLSLLSFLFSVLLVALLSGTSLIDFMDADISVFGNLPVIGLTALVSLLLGLLAGVYPAIYTTSFSPALVLKGSFGLSPRGRRFRAVLIGFQFVVSLVLIVAAIFAKTQNRYMRSMTSGFDKDNVVIVQLNGDLYFNHRKAYTERLKEFSGIGQVAFSDQKFSSSDQYMTWGRSYKGKDISFTSFPVSPEFLEVMNIRLTEGRNFTLTDEQRKSGVYIFNQRAKTEFGFALGESVDGSEIIGFTEDVNFASLRKEITPFCFYLFAQDSWGIPLTYSYIKIKSGTNMTAAIDHIRRTLRETDPQFPFEIEFFDQVMQQLYEKEENLSSLITLFSLLAVILSLVGVFGLVVFDTQYRRKEIGLRKINGATVFQVLCMFNREFVQILGICFVLAAPLAYYIVSKWLEGFAYQTPVRAWVFAMSLFIVLIITFATVTFQSYKAAVENPVKSVREE